MGKRNHIICFGPIIKHSDASTSQLCISTFTDKNEIESTCKCYKPQVTKTNDNSLFSPNVIKIIKSKQLILDGPSFNRAKFLVNSLECGAVEHLHERSQ